MSGADGNHGANAALMPWEDGNREIKSADDVTTEHERSYRASLGHCKTDVARLGIVDSRSGIDFETSDHTTDIAPTIWPDPLDLDALAEHEPRPPAFIIADWLPAGYATLFSGHGGVGKSGIALHLAACIALGRSFCVMPVEPRRVLYLSCEDRETVLHWRLTRICEHMEVEIPTLSGALDILDLVGHDCVLWERDMRTGNTLTAPYGLLDQRMRKQDTQVIIADGISDTYGGGENTRTDVKRFVNSLVALIPPETGAVLLVGHLSKPMASGAAPSTEGYSGSTAWHNSVRARWYLHPETAQNEDREAERTGDLILDLQKSNLGRMDRSVRFAWSSEAHMFLGREIIAATASDRAHRDQVERKGIREALDACVTNHPPVMVPAAATGPRTAYHVLSARTEFPATLRGGKAEKSRFWRHIEYLRHAGDIAEGKHRKADGHNVAQLLPGESANVE